MTVVYVKALFHRKREQIALYFTNDGPINKLIKTIPLIKWSQTNKCWYIPFDKNLLKAAYSILTGYAKLELEEFKMYLQKRNAVIATKVPAERNVQILHGLTKSDLAKFVISIENMDALKEMIKTLELKAYSRNTIALYMGEMLVLARLLGSRQINDLTVSQIQSYLLWLLKKKQYSESKIHTTINSLKFYFEQVLHNERMFLEIPRPKRPIKLPTVHSQNEVKRLINSKENTKHRTVLMLAYATGARVSEIVNLAVRDIDSERMVIYFRHAKGKKDRQVMLSEKLLLQLREYYREYKPKQYLFEGIDGGKYSERSVQQIFKSAKQIARNTKNGGIHSIRHTFATHLLEGGTDIKIIKELLGHNDLKTTERYTHVCIKNVNNLQSPLDRL